MKICLLGEFYGNLDEAARKISFHIAKELSNWHDLLTLDLRTFFHKNFWFSIKKFNPEIIHYIHGGSPKGFLLLSLISHLCPKAKTVTSIMRFSPLSTLGLLAYKPNLILAQSLKVKEKLVNIRCRVEFIPCGGVDTEKFVPISRKVKSWLREKYGVNKDKFVILHVGSIKTGRNILFLKKFQNDKNQVILVGPTSVGFDKKIVRQLKDSGCLVWARYFENIEEVYALSDCYIFPVPSKGNISAACIDVPLSVLEAMSCNLPVIATKFGVLPDIFEEGSGFFFAENYEEFANALERVKNGINVKTREKIKNYSWKNVGKRLEEIYFKLLNEK